MLLTILENNLQLKSSLNSKLNFELVKLNIISGCFILYVL